MANGVPWEGTETKMDPISLSRCGGAPIWCHAAAMGLAWDGHHQEDRQMLRLVFGVEPDIGGQNA